MLDGWTPQGNLLHVSFVKPHHPFDPPEPWASMYDPEDMELLPGWTDTVPPEDLPYQPGYFRNEELTPQTLRHVMAYYYASISQLDHHVGRMLTLLRERGIYDDTLVVFTADHGEYLGFHHQLLKHGRWMYDPLMRVPLIVKYPNGPDRLGTSEELVSQVDLAPSLLAAAGVEPATPLPGRDLTDADATEPPVLFADGPLGGMYMARTRTHKLLLTADEARCALFDLEEDAYELANRIDDPAYKGVRAELERALARWLLFDTPTPVHLYEDAPQISSPNVPPPNRSRRAALHEFFAAQIPLS